MSSSSPKVCLMAACLHAGCAMGFPPGWTQPGSDGAADGRGGGDAGLVDTGPGDAARAVDAESVGSDGDVGDSGSLDSAPADGLAPMEDSATPPMVCDRDGTAGARVAMIGDSYLALSEDVRTTVEASAKQAGALGDAQRYRPYYVPGAPMISASTGSSIPDQYREARAEDPIIEVVLMTGGGNDVLLDDRSCLNDAPPWNIDCAATVEAVRTTFRALLAEMGADGVGDVVFFFYPHLPPATLFTPLSGPAANDTLDYAYPLVRDVCEGATALRCHFIDTRPAFEGHPEYITSLDGVHLTSAGAVVIGDLLWNAMVAGCVAQ